MALEDVGDGGENAVSEEGIGAGPILGALGGLEVECRTLVFPHCDCDYFSGARGGGKLASAAGINYLVGDGGGRDIIFIRGDSTVLQGKPMSQARNGSPTKWIGDCSWYGARRNRNRRHKKERRNGAAKHNYLGSSRASISWSPEASAGSVILSV